MDKHPRLSFLEATGIMVGHGVGAGILSVPYLASRNSITEILVIIAFCIIYNIFLHLLIAELSLNNEGGQFVSCLDRELFTGKIKEILTWAAFILLGVSVIVNVTAYLTGAAAVFRSWFALPDWVGILIFYILGAGVVFFGIKIVGICEKYAVAAMLTVMVILLIRALTGTINALPTESRGITNVLALYGMVSFSLSAVMSTPQVVKGLQGDAKEIRKVIIVAVCVNACLIFLVTITTLIGVGKEITKDGAIVNLAQVFGGWVSVLGYLFTLLALATSFWSNTLNLRDIVNEQTKMGEKISWLAATAPCLVIAILGLSNFVDLSRFASVIQVVTGLAIIVAYHRSRNRVGQSRLLGKLGTTPFQIAVAICSVLATVGAVLPVK